MAGERDDREKHGGAETSARVDALMLIWHDLPAGVQAGVALTLLDGVLAGASGNETRAEMAARYPLTLDNLAVAMPHIRLRQEDVAAIIAGDVPLDDPELETIADTMRSHLVEDWFHEELAYHLRTRKEQTQPEKK